MTDRVARKMRTLIVKSLLSLLLYVTILVASASLLYVHLWQPMTGFGMPLFILAVTWMVVFAYFLGWLPAAGALFRELRDPQDRQQ